MTTRKQIGDFLSHQRIAIVGVSANPKDFSRSLMREFESRQYDVVPVNPKAGEMDGKRCYAHVQEIQPPVEAVLVMTKAAATGEVVRDCQEAGVKKVWMYRAGGQGAVNRDAVQFCASKGIDVVEGECPFMYLPDTQFVHKVHGFCKKLVGTYPK